MHSVDFRLYYTGLFLAAFALAPDGFAQGANGDVPDKNSEQLSPAAKAERRFPQPVRAGDLVGRQVLEPSNHKGVIGRVVGVARTRQGAVQIVVRYGGLLGYGARTIAVPVEATALLGQSVQVVDLDPTQLKALPDWTASAGDGVAPDERIRVGVNRKQYP